MLRIIKYMLAVVASFAFGFVLNVYLVGGGGDIRSHIDTLRYGPITQVSTKDRRGPALMRRDIYSAAAKADREALFTPHMATRLPKRLPAKILPPVVAGSSVNQRTQLVSFQSAPFP